MCYSDSYFGFISATLLCDSFYPWKNVLVQLDRFETETDVFGSTRLKIYLGKGRYKQKVVLGFLEVWKIAWAKRGNFY